MHGHSVANLLMGVDMFILKGVSQTIGFCYYRILFYLPFKSGCCCCCCFYIFFYGIIASYLKHYFYHLYYIPIQVQFTYINITVFAMPGNVVLFIVLIRPNGHTIP